MATNIEKIADELSKLTVLEAAELSKFLEEKWGVSAAAPVAAVAAAPAAGESSAEAQTEFEVVLSSVGDKKINVIKEVRSITGLGLAEAKGLVDNAPKSIKEGVSKEDAQSIKEKLEAAGAKAEIK